MQMLKHLLWILWLLCLLCCVPLVSCPSSRINLPLVEQLLTTLSKGGNAIDISRLCKSIFQETSQHPREAVELAKLRNDKG
jgi:hypothetical protein